MGLQPRDQGVKSSLVPPSQEREGREKGKLGKEESGGRQARPSGQQALALGRLGSQEWLSVKGEGVSLERATRSLLPVGSVQMPVTQALYYTSEILMRPSH